MAQKTILTTEKVQRKNIFRRSAKQTQIFLKEIFYYFLVKHLTPEHFKKTDPGTFRLNGQQDLLNDLASTLSSKQLKKLVGFLENPFLRKNPYQAEAFIKYRFNYLFKLPEKNYFMYVSDNFKDGLSILSAYDQIHGTDQAFTTGLKILKDLKKNCYTNNYEGIIYQVGLAALNSPDQEAIKKYLETLAISPLAYTIPKNILLKNFLLQDLINKILSLPRHCRPQNETTTKLRKIFFQQFNNN